MHADSGVPPVAGTASEQPAPTLANSTVKPSPEPGGASRRGPAAGIAAAYQAYLETPHREISSERSAGKPPGTPRTTREGPDEIGC
ncbi:hypothetical protein Srut_39490 [Streptomyces rutgersensis]|nr:hypothetical protein Srut_39490 [Streptomyces rutgersensis]